MYSGYYSYGSMGSIACHCQKTFLMAVQKMQVFWFSRICISVNHYAAYELDRPNIYLDITSTINLLNDFHEKEQQYDHNDDMIASAKEILQIITLGSGYP